MLQDVIYVTIHKWFVVCYIGLKHIITVIAPVNIYQSILIVQLCFMIIVQSQTQELYICYRTHPTDQKIFYWSYYVLPYCLATPTPLVDK